MKRCDSGLKYLKSNINFLNLENPLHKLLFFRWESYDPKIKYIKYNFKNKNNLKLKYLNTQCHS